MLHEKKPFPLCLYELRICFPRLLAEIKVAPNDSGKQNCQNPYISTPAHKEYLSLAFVGAALPKIILILTWKAYHIYKRSLMSFLIGREQFVHSITRLPRAPRERMMDARANQKIKRSIKKTHSCWKANSCTSFVSQPAIAKRKRWNAGLTAVYDEVIRKAGSTEVKRRMELELRSAKTRRERASRNVFWQQENPKL